MSTRNTQRGFTPLEKPLKDNGVRQPSSMNRRRDFLTGFTLVETLVAISVLLVSLAGPLTIATKGLSSALFARDQVVAFYLAGEAVEYVRNVRDTNILNNRDWLEGLAPCLSGNVCSIDVKNAAINECAGTCELLHYDGSTGFYSYTAGPESPFTRDISIEAVNDDEVAILVTIGWRTGTLTREFSVRENILNWQ